MKQKVNALGDLICGAAITPENQYEGKALRDWVEGTGSMSFYNTLGLRCPMGHQDEIPVGS